jgi:adenylate kinase
MLRAAIEADTPLGREAGRYMTRGELVPDHVVIELVQARVAEPDCARGYILDGFPRTITQAEALRAAGLDLDFVIDIAVDDEEILRRMSGRRVHPGSGRTYHLEFNPPQKEGLDDLTGEPLVQRPDDEEATVRRRIATYHEQTRPLVDYYLKWNASGKAHAPRYVKIDGHGSVEAVRERIARALVAQSARTRT